MQLVLQTQAFCTCEIMVLIMNRNSGVKEFLNYNDSCYRQVKCFDYKKPSKRTYQFVKPENVNIVCDSI